MWLCSQGSERGLVYLRTMSHLTRSPLDHWPPNPTPPSTTSHLTWRPFPGPWTTSPVVPPPRPWTTWPVVLPLAHELPWPAVLPPGPWATWHAIPPLGPWATWHVVTAGPECAVESGMISNEAGEIGTGTLVGVPRNGKVNSNQQSTRSFWDCQRNSLKTCWLISLRVIVSTFTTA